MLCLRCGDCCKRCFVALDNIPVDKDEKELARWLSYHGVGVFQKDGCLAIELPSPCKPEYLQQNEDGTYTCLIHETRPVICKEFYCENAQAVSKAVEFRMVR